MSRWPRLVVAALLAATTACAHWEPDQRPVPEVVAGEPDKVRITRHDGSEVIVVAPVVHRDRVEGMLGTPRGKVDRDSTVSVPVADIDSLYRWDPGDTAVAYGALVGFTVLLTAFFVSAIKGT